MILSLKSLYVTARRGTPKTFMWSMSREKSAPLLPINLVHLHLSTADWLHGGGMLYIVSGISLPKTSQLPAPSVFSMFLYWLPAVNIALTTLVNSSSLNFDDQTG